MSIFCRDFIVMLLNKFLRCVQANILCIYIYMYIMAANLFRKKSPKTSA